ncbi:MAG: hypothetical protein KAI72_06035, partial [Candidatus Pacebacteria bacterium]|nr:hypothetical protein [Candidatus Paceibacterota bacterium]
MQLSERNSKNSWFFRSVAIIIIWSFFSLQVCWANGSQLINEDVKREEVSYLAPDVAINTGDFAAVFKTATESIQKDSTSLGKVKEKGVSEQNTPEEKPGFLDTLTNKRGNINIIEILSFTGKITARVFATMGIGFVLTTMTPLGAVSVAAIIAGWILVPMVAKILFPESKIVNGLARILKTSFYGAGVLGIVSLVMASGGTAAAVGIFMNKALLLKVFSSLVYVVGSMGVIRFAFSKGWGKSGATRKAILLTPIIVLAASAGLAEIIGLNSLINEESSEAAPDTEESVTEKTAGEEAKAPVTEKTAGEENSPEQINLQKSLDDINSRKDELEVVSEEQLQQITNLEKLFAENKTVLDKYADTGKWDSTAPKWDIPDADKPVFEYGVDIPEANVENFEQLMNRFITVFNTDDINDLEGKVNPITGREYSITHLANVNWEQELTSPQEVTGNVRDAITAYQHASGIREDGDLGPQTKAQINTEYLQEQINVTTDEYHSSQEQWSKLDAQQKQYSDELAANAAVDAKPEVKPEV